MPENENKKSGKWKEVLGWIVAVAVAFLIIAWRRQRTVRNFITLFQENAVEAIIILVVAVAVVIGVTALRNYLQKRRK